MKTATILFMLITIIAILGYGVMYLLGFAMSFDAPGSTSDPKAWGMRILMFSPLIVLIILLILSAMSFFAGNYKKSAILGSVPAVLCAGFVAFMFISSFTALRQYQTTQLREKEDELRYPKQTFLRNNGEKTDTIIVFPNRIVSYRLDVGAQYPFAGPLGDLNEERNTLLFKYHFDTRLKPEELEQFVDGNGRRFTEVYNVE